MRKARLLLLGATVVIGTLSAGSSFAAPADCTEAQKTKAGSCKNSSGEISCGSDGRLPVDAGGIGVAVNNDADGPEAEACNGTGSPQTRGRLVVRGSTSGPGARASLDTDKGQPFPPGYINVQVSPTDPGVWCNKEGDPATQSDGYRRPWNNPGTDGGADATAANCVPDAPF